MNGIVFIAFFVQVLHLGSRGHRFESCYSDLLFLKGLIAGGAQVNRPANVGAQTAFRAVRGIRGDGQNVNRGSR
jgi:hypothetical protein